MILRTGAAEQRLHLLYLKEVTRKLSIQAIRQVLDVCAGSDMRPSDMWYMQKDTADHHLHVVISCVRWAYTLKITISTV